MLTYTDLSIAEIFAACGVDYNGNFIKTFKTLVGMTPSEFRSAYKNSTPNTTNFSVE